MRSLVYLLFSFALALLASSCSNGLTGDHGKILGRWEEAGKKFDYADSTNSVIWYQFDEELNANSYVGEFTYKLDTAKKTLTATTHMIGTDGHTKFNQLFFEKNYVLRNDTLILSYISKTTGKELKTILIRKH